MINYEICYTDSSVSSHVTFTIIKCQSQTQQTISRSMVVHYNANYDVLH